MSKKCPAVQSPYTLLNIHIGLSSSVWSQLHFSLDLPYSTLSYQQHPIPILTLYCTYPYWNWANMTQGRNDPGSKRHTYLGQYDPPQKLAETTQGQNYPNISYYTACVLWILRIDHFCIKTVRGVWLLASRILITFVLGTSNKGPGGQFTSFSMIIIDFLYTGNQQLCKSGEYSLCMGSFFFHAWITCLHIAHL